MQTNANLTKNHSHIHASTQHQDPATSLKQNMSTPSSTAQQWVFPANPTPTSTSPSLPSNSLPCPEEVVRNMSAKRSRKRPSFTNRTTQVGHA
ncbi:hypothetical protein K443DRAFT_684515, partial [Laccaria amethystina LaAM-08-1]